MKAIIVCNGLDNKAADEWKPCLVRLNNGETIFERQIRLLHENGITEFVISAASNKEQLQRLAAQKAYAHLRFIWTDDSAYERQNGIFVPPARGYGEETVLLSGALVFNRALLERLLDGRYNAVGFNWTEDSKDVFLAHVVGGQIRELSLEEPNADCYVIPPLYRLDEEPTDIADFRVDICEDGYIKELRCPDDLEAAAKEVSYYDIVEQKVFYAPYSIYEVERIREKHRICKPLIVGSTDSRYIKLYLDMLLGAYAHFEPPAGTPDYDDIVKGADIFVRENCDAIISIGGDSAADTAKLIRLFVLLDDKDSYLSPAIPLTELKHIAIPTAADARSQALPTAVMTRKGERQKIRFDGLLPDYVVFEPKFLDELEAEEKKSAALEALCLCVESMWAVHSGRKSRGLAEQALSLLLNGLFEIAEGKIERTADIFYAKYLSHKAVYYSGTTAAYAVSRKISEFLSITVGMAAANCAPYFWRYYADHLTACSDDITRKMAAEALNTIKMILGVNTSFEMALKVPFLAEHVMDMPWPAYKEHDFDAVSASLDERSLKNTPVVMDAQHVRRILQDAFIRECYWDGITPPSSDGYTGQQSFSLYWRQCLSTYVLNRTREIKREILNETVGVCAENGLDYFLSYGTLLGAVRHNGFIPWNDNIELSMPLPDYNKFLKIADQALAPDYYLYHGQNDPHCWFEGTRVCKAGTHIETSKDRFFYARKRGIFITIYPMSTVKGNKRSKNRYKLVRALNAIIACRLNPSSRKLRIRANTIMLFLRPFSLKRLQKIYRRLQNGFKGDFIVLGHKYAAAQEMVPKKLVFPLAVRTFAGCEYKVPANSEAVLKKIYDDYQELPDEEMRTIPQPLRVAFKEDEWIDFNAGAKRPARSSVPTNLLLEKSASISAKMLRNVRQLFGPTKLPKRTMTRIAGMFRTCGIRLSKNSRELASYRDKYAGQRCFLIGNGPSLKAEDLDLLKDEVTFGCNLIYKIFEQTIWRPTFYCVSDSGITRNHSRELVENIDCKTLMIREFAYKYMEVKPWNAVKLPYISVDWYKVHGNMLAYHYISHATVMSMMIELAFYMGFKEVYLLGVDGTSASAKGSHFTDAYFSKAMKEYGDNVKKKLYKNYDPAVRAAYLQKRTLMIFEKLKEYADSHGMTIYNATRGGVIEVFERADFDSVIANTNE